MQTRYEIGQVIYSSFGGTKSTIMCKSVVRSIVITKEATFLNFSEAIVKVSTNSSIKKGFRLACWGCKEDEVNTVPQYGAHKAFDSLDKLKEYIKKVAEENVE